MDAVAPGAAPPDPPRAVRNYDPAVVALVGARLRDPAPAVLERTLSTLPPAAANGAPGQALRGELLRRRGEPARAAALLEAALAALPELHAAYHCAALARVAAGDLAAARALWLALLERVPADPAARYQIALTWHDERAHAEAAREYEAQLRQWPASFAAWFNLGLVRLELDQPAAAAAALERAVALDAGTPRAWMALGDARRRGGDARGAAAAWMRAHALEPAAVAPLALAAAAFADAAELPPAVAALDQAIALAPDSAALRWARAAHLSSLGEHEAALADLRTGIALDPADGQGASALLVELQYIATPAAAVEFDAARSRWAAAHAAGPARVIAAPRRAPHAPLRIGYLSPRFGAGPLASFFLPVLRAHDRRHVHVTLYAAHVHADAVAAELRASADAWRALPADDAAAAAMIEADGLDLLVDLAGHTPGHRLPLLARRPAPVQATWLDWFDTTGVGAIDYLLSDAIHTPPAVVAHYSERLVLLPHCRFVYAPQLAPALSAPPCIARGHVTFGSFNRHAKIGAATLAAWSAVLAAVPGARLELRAAAYAGASTVAWLRERWSAAGVPVDRIDFRPYVPLADAMRAYAGIDVALDTFPYNGGATTCDALAAGVPVVALAGGRMVARQGAALLAAAGHPEWVAADGDDYVRIATALAQPALLAALRPRLAHALPASPLCAVAPFVAALERAYAALVAAGPAPAGAARPAPPLVIADADA
jgi:predicted O-linked N-acetylglucosamine transferase (SPINDLY family)